MDSSHRTKCAATNAEDSKYKYAKSSTHSQGFLFQHLEGSLRIITCIRFTCSISRHYNWMISRPVENVMQNSFSLLKCCFLMRHPVQGKEFSRCITPISGWRRISMQYDFMQYRLHFQSVLGWYYKRSPHRNLPVTVSSDWT